MLNVDPEYNFALFDPIIKLPTSALNTPVAVPQLVPLSVAAFSTANVKAFPEKRLLLSVTAVALNVSLNVLKLAFRLLSATSTPPFKVPPPCVALRDKLCLAAKLASVKVMAFIAFEVVCIAISRLAEILLPMSMVLLAFKIKSSAVAAASPNIFTPTPFSVALIKIRFAYIPPNALESIA